MKEGIREKEFRQGMNKNERRNEIGEMKLKEGRNINVGMKDKRRND